jgi:L-asparaginase II
MSTKPLSGVSPPICAEVRRGGIRESLHTAYCAEWGGNRLLWSAGDADFVTTLRSAAKPLQALPLVTLPNADELDLQDEELAICCASHPGLPRHTALAASVLALSGYLPDDLVCGFAGDPPSPLKHGCSGNHAALLAGAHLLGAPLRGYELPKHPVQQAVSKLVVEMAGATDMQTVPDGCGIPTFGLRLREMARSFAELCRPDTPWSRIPRVMGSHPELIGSGDWIDVRLMQVTGGRVIAKTGAEGLLCIGMPGEGRGMAVKILDGSTRALGAAVVHVLQSRDWITAEEANHEALSDLRRPLILDSRGQVVGEIVVEPMPA